MFFRFDSISGYPAVLYYCQVSLRFFILVLLNSDFRVFGSFMRFFRQELDCIAIGLRLSADPSGAVGAHRGRGGPPPFVLYVRAVILVTGNPGDAPQA